MKNASDEFRHQLVAELATGGGTSHGSLAPSSDGSFTYTPSAGYVGADSFTFRVKDATGTYSSTQTVNLTVVNNLSASPCAAIPLERIPRHADLHAERVTTCTTYGGYGGYGGYQTCTTAPGTYGGSVSGDAMDVSYDIDGDPLTAILVSGPVGLTLSPDGSFSYSSSNSYGGSFTFNVSDGFTTSGSYTVNLYYGPGGTPSTDFELSPGESFYTGGRASGHNGGPGTVLVTGYSSTSVSFAPVSGSSFSVSVSNGHANWTVRPPVRCRFRRLATSTPLRSPAICRSMPAAM